MGGWFYNRRDGKFLKSLYIVGRGVLAPLFYEDPLHFFVPPSLLFFLLSSFFGWMGDRATFDMLFYLAIIWIYTCQTLVL